MGRTGKFFRVTGPVLAMALLAGAGSAFGQASGFNFTIGYGHDLVQHEKAISMSSIGLGLAYQQDFNLRFGAGLDAVLGIDEASGILSYEGIYSAKYFFMDNDMSAVYAGSFIGIQSIKADVTVDANGYSSSRNKVASKVQVPIGIRAGLRGGLDGYFGELFVQAGYAIGNGTLYRSNDAEVKTAPLFFNLGFSFLGFGWDH